ncbi:MAG: hypothetical protein ACK5LR_04750 [Mangrovibacterium sp.]
MPLNLLKKYNQLLELAAYSPSQRTDSLKGVFCRDIENNRNFSFRTKPISPTPSDGEIKMETLFRHLTTVITDESTNGREFDMNRAVRLHWIKHHIEEKKKDNILVFSTQEGRSKRTYIYDKDEKYVIVFEPLRNGQAYYLLTAYHVRGKDAGRDKFMQKYKRRLPEIL